MAADSTPSNYHVALSDLPALEGYAKERGFLAANETLDSAVKAGEGNMNLTLRLVTDRRSLILKQARPWVEKYPQIPAPAERALVEIAFYETVSPRPVLAKAMPRLLASDPERRVLVLEDLGDAQDLTTLYAGGTLARDELRELTGYLRALHEPFETIAGDRRRALENREMRALNHTHIFDLPLAEDNGLDLDAVTPGLARAAHELKRDRAYLDRVRALGALYLQNGAILVHGDYFPGSWLRTTSGLRVIDPEFCFLGTPAFDLGVMLAHLLLAHQPAELGDALFEVYGNVSLEPRSRQFAGVEIMRRLIGVAQLPLAYGIEEKRALLEKSRQLVHTEGLP